LPKGGILGVGTGSTVNFLIDLLPELQLEAAVASSNATAERLKKLGIEVVDMNSVGGLMLMLMVQMKLIVICI
jgi:ribose 5-phosphate isomerase A